MDKFTYLFVLKIYKIHKGVKLKIVNPTVFPVSYKLK